MTIIYHYIIITPFTGSNDFLIYGGLELRCIDETMAIQVEHIFSKVYLIMAISLLHLIHY